MQNNSGIRSLPDLVDVFVPSTSISNVNQNEDQQGNSNSNDPIVQAQVFEQQGGGGGGGCFIATATSGDKNSSLVKRYTLIRDYFLVNFDLGRSFIQFYYSYSPPIAQWIERSFHVKSFVWIDTLSISIYRGTICIDTFVTEWLHVFSS